MKNFDNKVAAITGAASGMGRTLALELARRGCHLALSDINEAGLAATAQMVGSKVKVTTARVDTSKRQEIDDWAAQVVRDHGKVNMIFNNAGVGLAAPLEHVSQKDFDWIMDINFWGVVWGTQAFLPYLIASGDGHVVNTSSMFGLISMPLNGCYNASKFAVRGYTECLRMELELAKHPVSATCVHPGGIRTNIAMAARMDESMKTLMPGDIEKRRKALDKVLNTTSAESAAHQIVRAVEKNKRRLLIGPDAKVAHGLERLLGAAYQRLILIGARAQQKQRTSSK